MNMHMMANGFKAFDYFVLWNMGFWYLGLVIIDEYM